MEGHLLQKEHLSGGENNMADIVTLTKAARHQKDVQDWRFTKYR